MNTTTETRVRVTITVRAADGTTQERGGSYDSLQSMGERLALSYQPGEIVNIEFHN
jgi:hypothetical protein